MLLQFYSSRLQGRVYWKRLPLSVSAAKPSAVDRCRLWVFTQSHCGCLPVVPLCWLPCFEDARQFRFGFCLWSCSLAAWWRLRQPLVLWTPSYGTSCTGPASGLMMVGDHTTSILGSSVVREPSPVYRSRSGILCKALFHAIHCPAATDRQLSGLSFRPRFRRSPQPPVPWVHWLTLLTKTFFKKKKKNFQP